MKIGHMTRKSGFVLVALVGLVAVLVTAASVGNNGASNLAGRWDAVVTVGKVEVPFAFEIGVDGTSVQGWFFNGDRRISSTAGRLENGVLTLDFDQYATKIEAKVSDEGLVGEYRRPRGPYPFHATKAASRIDAAGAAPSIDGTWIVSAKSNKGESAWRFIVKQAGNDVSATILRVDGDTGTLTGGFKDGRFVLSHFSGARPLLLEVKPREDGTLTLTQNGQTELVAAREGDARAAAIGVPTDPSLHTSVNDPSEPFRFAFPDLEGRLVSNTDPRFANKVVLVNISGSWCPNCHDEAPFLASLYRKYRDKGLEIVSLSFEEGEQLHNPTRLRAFLETYGIDYTVLIPGEPDQLAEKVPQAVNLNAFPTTFILGRDGRVRAVHAGFPSPGSGEYYSKAEREVTEQVERLLAELGT
jgi:thiol-disulfide isomerase/thioredoxin